MLRSLVLVGTVACRISDVDLTGKHCPCPDDYTCDLATQTCAHSVAMVDAPKPDGVADGVVDGLAVQCPPGVDICDTFEGGILPVWTPGGTVTIDSTIAHRGNASLHAHLDALSAGVGGRATLTETHTFAASAPFWVRAWVKIASLPTAGNHLEIMSTEQTHTSSDGDYVFFEATAVDVYSQFSNGIRSTSSGAATGTWICLVWHVTPAASNGVLELSGDIAMPLTYNGTTDGAPSIGQLVIGLQFASSNVSASQPALDLWIDDVIVDHAAVSCTE
jgi:hypothetical protein